MIDKILTLVHEITGNSRHNIQVTLRDRLHHQSNDLYDVHFDNIHWIAKVFVKEHELREASAREFGALEKLDGFDIAPKPIHFVPYPDSRNPIVIYEYMDGDMWDRQAPSDDLLHLLAKALNTIHQVENKKMWLSAGWEKPLPQQFEDHKNFLHIYIDWAKINFPEGVTHAKRGLDLFDTHKATMQKLIDQRPALLFSRSDLRFANIIQRPDGRIGLIDWEDSGLHDPARTISDMILHPNNEDLVSQNQWDTFINIYAEDFPHDIEELKQRITWYNHSQSLMWFGGLLMLGTHQAQAGTLSDWRINEMIANLRLRRYFARCLALPHTDYENILADIKDIRFFPI